MFRLRSVRIAAAAVLMSGRGSWRIEEAVASGRYAPASEVIRDALHEWEIVQARRE